MAAADRVIQPDLELRCLPVVRGVGECLRACAIGKPLMASVRLWCNWGYGGGQWKYNPEEEGFFPWLGCWYLDLLDYVFAAPPERATVTGGYAANGRLMDHGWAALEYPGGRIGRFDFNLVAVTGLDVRLGVLGDRGEAEVDVIEGNLRWRESDGVWHEATHPASLPICGFVGLRECLTAFVESVRTGQPPQADVEVARRVHAAMLACTSRGNAGDGRRGAVAVRAICFYGGTAFSSLPARSTRCGTSPCRGRPAGRSVPSALVLVLLVLDAGRSLELRILVNQGAVLVDGGAGLLGDLAIRIEARARKKMSKVCHSPAGLEAITLGGVWL